MACIVVESEGKANLPSPAEIERRNHVESAIANSRIEGFPPPCSVELEICEACIRGEIKAEDLVEVFKKRRATFGR